MAATRGRLGRALTRLEAFVRERRHERPVLERLRRDPSAIMTVAGMDPDAWQRDVLGSSASRMLLLASRQSGKSSVAAALALKTALLKPGSPILLLSPTMRQSGELFKKVIALFGSLGRPVGVAAESALRLELANGSRIISLPGTEGTVRGFSGVGMLIIDEAARVSDALYLAVRPMLAVSQGKLVALSTPFGKRGFFHDEWHGGGDWHRVRVTADQCPRIPRAFLEEERRALGERVFLQEYMTSFQGCIYAVFSYEDIQAALTPDVRPLFADG